MDSDVDLMITTVSPDGYRDVSWSDCLPHTTLLCTGHWGPVAEYRLGLPSGLEIEVGVAPVEWASTDPVDRGTRRVVLDGLRILHDPERRLHRLARACEGKAPS